MFATAAGSPRCAANGPASSSAATALKLRIRFICHHSPGIILSNDEDAPVVPQIDRINAQQIVCVGRRENRRVYRGEAVPSLQKQVRPAQRGVHDGGNISAAI